MNVLQCMIYNFHKNYAQISNVDSARYDHTDPTRISTELWKLSVIFRDWGRHSFNYDSTALLFLA